MLIGNKNLWEFIVILGIGLVQEKIGIVNFCVSPVDISFIHSPTTIKLWKTELQKLANEINLVIHVSHFPPGTSKWNKIEHRMFSFITKN